MKIVFDTNVLISGFLTANGISQYVFSIGIKRHTVICSEFIFGELEEKLAKKLAVPKEMIEQLVSFLRKRTIVLSVTKSREIKFADEDDIPVLSLIEASKANYFITGDRKLLAIKKLGPTLFLSPREAMEVL